MDLVQTVRKEGSRGGRANFSWEDVKNDQHRENYLGHSLMAPVGRWQKGRDLNWYARAEGEQEKSEEDLRKEEIQRVKAAEKVAMAKALGYELPDQPSADAPSNPNLTEVGPRDKKKQDSRDDEKRSHRHKGGHRRHHRSRSRSKEPERRHRHRYRRDGHSRSRSRSYSRRSEGHKGRRDDEREHGRRRRNRDEGYDKESTRHRYDSRDQHDRHGGPRYRSRSPYRSNDRGQTG